MAQPQSHPYRRRRCSSSIICLLLMAVVFLLPAADATFLPNPNVQGLFVNGKLCCSQNGNCPGSGPLAGVNVTLTCKNTLVATVVGRNITNANGTFSNTVPAATIGAVTLGLPILPCAIFIQLPLAAAICPELSTVSGAVVGLLQDAGTVNSQTLGVLRQEELGICFAIGIGSP